MACRQDASTFAMVLTQSAPALITGALDRLGVPEGAYLVRRVPPDEIPRYLRAADIAMSFIKPSYSKLASSPTKIAEYLASGLPIVCNAGVGDLDELIEEEGVGVLVRELKPRSNTKTLCARWMGCFSRDRSRAVAAQGTTSRFDLESIGGERYCRLYRRLPGSPEHAFAGAVDR